MRPAGPAGGYPTAPSPGDLAQGVVGHIAVSSQAVPVMTTDPSQALLEHLLDSYMADFEISLDVVHGLLARCGSDGVDWSLRSEDGMSMLHLAVMNEATPPEKLRAVVCELVRRGAPLDVEDEDGDTPLGAVMAIASDGVQGDPEKEVDEDTAKAQLAQLAAVRALVSCPQLPLPPEKVWELTSWLRSTFPSRLHGEFLADLRARVGNKEVDKAWCSEMMMQYLEDTAYDNKEGVSAAKVRDFLDGGARPGHKTNSATALLLVVLNPYSTLAELTEVFRLMLSVDPAVATERDNFKLSALQWAADYRSVSSQHGLRQPNPATFLALLPVLVSLLPPELDAGETCYKTSPDGFCTASPTGRAAFHPRFMEGDRVDVRVDAPGEGCVWEEGVVIGLWYRESCWPAEHPGAPYQVRLDIGTQVFALVDHDRIIRREGDRGAAAPTARPARGTAAPKAKAAAKGPKRFQKRQREDGAWELLDTVSGKARPSSPPDSDED